MSVVVPVRDGADLLPRLAASLQDQPGTIVELVVNDDPVSSDDTAAWCQHASSERLPITYCQVNTRLGEGRLEGARRARGEVLVFLDADMLVEPGLLAEGVRLLEVGATSVVLTEEQVAHDFWGRCKWLEKRAARNSDIVESARMFSRQTYWAAGGHDPDLVFGEDKDIDLKVRRLGGPVARTRSQVLHDDGEWTLRRQYRRTRYWAQHIDPKQVAQNEGVAIQAGFAWRLEHYASRWRLLAQHPLLASGIVVLRMVDLAGVVASRRPSADRGKATYTAARRRRS